jgi:molecular chaperone DnaK
VRPGICEQIGEVLLVGGTTRMPAVREALSREFGWNPKLADPDLAVAKGAALYASQISVRVLDPTVDAALRSSPGAGGVVSTSAPDSTGSEEVAVNAIAARTGITEEAIRKIARRTVVNVLPKAIGIKLVDTAKPGWEEDPASAYYIERAVRRGPGIWAGQ